MVVGSQRLHVGEMPLHMYDYNYATANKYQPMIMSAPCNW